MSVILSNGKDFSEKQFQINPMIEHGHLNNDTYIRLFKSTENIRSSPVFFFANDLFDSWNEFVEHW